MRLVLKIKIATWSHTFRFGPEGAGVEIIKLAGTILSVGIDISLSIGNHEV